MDVPWWALVTAVAPVAVLAVLVLRSQPLVRSAWIAAGTTAVLAATVFDLDPGAVAVGTVRGVWTGAWILAIVLPALLLFEVLDRSGALGHLAEAGRAIAPTPGRQRLLLGWVLPSFLQGAAGFGTPVAMSAPMLVKLGMAPVAALSTALIGYQWSVTFGSMGSSYFMASATARLGDAAAASFALRAGIILAVSAVLSGLIVVLRRGEDAPGQARRDVPVTLLVGLVMAVTLVGVVLAQPALGSTAAGLSGLLVAWAVLPQGRRPRGREVLLPALPYLVLTGMVTVAFGVPPVRDLLDRVPVVAPVLSGSEAAFGHANPAASLSPVFRPLLHPWIYLLLATVVAVVAFRRYGWWPTGATRAALRGWGRRSLGVASSIVALTVLAALMTDAGMVTAIAGALAAGLGMAFVAVSPLLGTFGTALTGSTTASNALFSALQAGVAGELGVSQEALLAGQTAGGNVGNALSPVNVAVGAAALGIAGREGEVIRRNLPAAGLLIAVVIAAVLLQVLPA